MKELFTHAEIRLEADGQPLASGGWQIKSATLPDTATALTVCCTAALPELENWIWSLHLTDASADHLLTQGASMGGCQSLSKDSPETDFAGSSMLLLRRGNTLWMLEFAPESAGEAFWCGHWRGGHISGFRAELRERFARTANFPEIRLEIRSGTDADAMLKAWAQRQCGKRRISHAPALRGAGWNSWDYYRWSVTAEDVLANAEFITRDPVLAKHISRIVIDDGWMDCYGDWEPNSRFREMPALVRELRKMGFVPGLWFAPAVAEPQSMIAQQHWEYLACGESGWPCLGYECMQRRGFLLDPTRREVQSHLFQLFRRYKEMGFGYFKLDFLSHTLNARRFADRSASAPDIIRAILRPIAEAVGPETAIMGCNHLFAAGSEYVDLVRVASDIHARFDSLQQNSVSVATRMAMHGVRWLNDPDFAVVRGPATSDDPDMTRLRPNQVYVTSQRNPFDDACGKWTCAGDMSLDEAKILLGLVVISAGEVNFSDALFKLNAAGLALVRRAAEAERGKPGHAEDLMTHALAAQFVQALPSGGMRRMWINWDPMGMSIVLPPSPAGTAWRDFWTGAPLEPNAITLPPHAALLAEYHEN